MTTLRSAMKIALASWVAGSANAQAVRTVCEIVGQLKPATEISVKIRDEVLYDGERAVLVSPLCDAPLVHNLIEWPPAIAMAPAKHDHASSTALLQIVNELNNSDNSVRATATFSGVLVTNDVFRFGETGFGRMRTCPAQLTVNEVSDVAIERAAPVEDLQPHPVCEVLKAPQHFNGKRAAVYGAVVKDTNQQLLCGDCDGGGPADSWTPSSCLHIDFARLRMRIRIGIAPAPEPSPARSVGSEEPLAEGARAPVKSYVGRLEFSETALGESRGRPGSRVEFGPRSVYPARLDFEGLGSVVTGFRAVQESTRSGVMQSSRARYGHADERCEGARMLFEAVEFGCEDRVRGLLRSGVDVTQRSPEGESLLRIAITRRHPAIVRFLVEAGADAAQDWNGWTPLCYAVRLKDPEVVKFLISHGASVHETPSGGCVPLSEAAQYADVSTLQVLLDAGASLESTNQWGWTPLIAALARRNLANARFLLTAGADPDAADDGGTLLSVYACVDEVAEMLLDAGANVNGSAREGKTPLMLASENACAQAVRRFITAGASVNLQDHNGDTALMWAVRGKCTECIDALRTSGADLELRNRDGKNAAELAMASEHSAALLQALRSEELVEQK